MTYSCHGEERELSRARGRGRALCGTYVRRSAMSFAGLLPAEGTTPEKLLQALDGEALLNALGEPQTRRSMSRSRKLHRCHGQDAAEGAAARHGHGAGVYRRCGFLPPCREAAEDPIPCSTRFGCSSTSRGRQAAAVTSTLMAPTAAADMEEPKTIALTRPFLFVIFDHETQSIVFLGIVNQIS